MDLTSGVALKFEWDENKNRANIKKHGFSFAEATHIFRDPNALYMPDPDHSESEERWLGLGSLRNLTLVVTVFVDRSESNEQIIRIISARKASKAEKQQYLNQI